MYQQWACKQRKDPHARTEHCVPKMERNSEHEAADDTTPADSGSKVVPGGDDKTDDAEPGREASGDVSNGSKAPEKLVQEEDPDGGS